MTTLAPKSKPNSSKTILPPFFGVSTRQPPSHRFLGFARRLALRTRVPFRLLAYGVAHLNDGGSNRNDNSQHLYKRTHIVLRFLGLVLASHLHTNFLVLPAGWLYGHASRFAYLRTVSHTSMMVVATVTTIVSTFINVPISSSAFG